MEVSRGKADPVQSNELYADDYATESLDLLSQYCSEFLVHAADVEGLCQGIDEDLVTSASIRLLCYGSVLRSEIELGEWVKVPTTYAGGAKGQPSLVPWGLCRAADRPVIRRYI